MQKIQKDNFIFYVDIEKTKSYYLSHSICDCCTCRNLYAQVEKVSAELTEFLSEFGIDIRRPDEASSIEMEGYVDYLFHDYLCLGFERKNIYES